MPVVQMRPSAPTQKPKLIDQVRETIRRKHYSIRTEEAYVDWVKRFIFFHNKRHILAHLEGRNWLMASLLYGAGLRLMECLRLRVKDIDFEYRQITVRDGKGNKDRVTMLPDSSAELLKHHLEKVQVLHEQDLAAGGGEVYLPNPLEQKYKNASREWGWQYVFPAAKRSIDPRSGAERRHHADEKCLQRAMKRAVRAARINKLASCHTLRHSFASHLLRNGYDIHPVR